MEHDYVLVHLGGEIAGVKCLKTPALPKSDFAFAFVYRTRLETAPNNRKGTEYRGA